MPKKVTIHGIVRQRSRVPLYRTLAVLRVVGLVVVGFLVVEFRLGLEFSLAGQEEEEECYEEKVNYAGHSIPDNRMDSVARGR